MKYKFTLQDASQYGWEGLTAHNFRFEDINEGMSVVHVESIVRHGEVSTHERKRLYYILEGQGTFYIGDESFLFQAGDLIVVPPNTKYDYEPKSETIKALLIMELLDK